MVLRKRKQPTPDFKLPPPFQPITGQRAQLRMFGVFPYCAMMQVAAEDTHTDYVLCRGFDIRIPKFIDYDENDLANNPGIPVAKPFSYRLKGVYRVAHIFPAFLPLQTGNPSPADVPWRVGQNPGVAETCPCQPCDLDEKVDFLWTDTDPPVLINWMMTEWPENLRGGCLDEDHPGCGVVFDIHLAVWDSSTNGWNYDTGTVSKAIDWRYGVPYPEAGSTGLFTPRPSDLYGTIWETVVLDCETPGNCESPGNCGGV